MIAVSCCYLSRVLQPHSVCFFVPHSAVSSGVSWWWALPLPGPPCPVHVDRCCMTFYLYILTLCPLPLFSTCVVWHCRTDCRPLPCTLAKPLPTCHLNLHYCVLRVACYLQSCHSPLACHHSLPQCLHSKLESTFSKVGKLL